MRKISILIFTFLLISCGSDFKVIEKPTDYSEIVKRRKIIGANFSENGDCFMCLQNVKRFSPSLEEIKHAESILRENIRETNSRKINQGNGCLIIHNNLNKYRRQYFGYYNEINEKVIYVTFNKNELSLIEKIKGFQKDKSENWKKEKESWFDGCSNHWEVKINLKTEKLFEFGVNGSG